MTDESEQPTKPSPQEMQQVVLHNFIWPVLCSAVNGLRLSLPSVPIAHLLVTICGLAGRVTGETVSRGSLTDVLKIRAECIKVFGEGVRSVKMTPEQVALDIHEKPPILRQ